MTCMVDYERRSRVAPNHTMTHVLNYALRAVLLGGQNDSSGMCEQKGSSVDADRLRFDFSWSKPLTPEQVEKVCQPPITHSPLVHRRMVQHALLSLSVCSDFQQHQWWAPHLTCPLVCVGGDDRQGAHPVRAARVLVHRPARQGLQDPVAATGGSSTLSAVCHVRMSLTA